MDVAKLTKMVQVDAQNILIERGEYMQFMLDLDGERKTFEVMVDENGKLHLHGDEELTFTKWVY